MLRLLSYAICLVTKIGRPLLSGTTTLIGLTILTFCLGRFLPIDPVVVILGDGATAQAYAAMSHKLGLDQPVWIQYKRYLVDLLHGNLGISMISGNSVTNDIGHVFPATVELACIAILFGVGLGVPMGVMAAMYRNSPLDGLIRVFSITGYSLPAFWLGLMGLDIFYAKLGWVEGPGRIDLLYEFPPVTGFILLDAALQGNTEAFRNALGHIILPGSILSLSSVAYISRMTRSFMVEQLGYEYIVTARAKGFSWMRIVFRHAFPNVTVQIITVIILSFAFLLEGAVLTETVFSWPGFGSYMANALLLGDMNTVTGCVLLVGVVFVTLNFLSDVLYRIVDPRIR